MIFRYLTVLVSLLTTCAVGEEATLKNAFQNHFYVGTAVGRGPTQEANGATLKMVAAQFNSITPEFQMKWQYINPKPNEFTPQQTDEFTDFGARNSMYVVGHVLFWHNCTPDWVFTGPNGKPVTREELLARMREHVRYFAKRYKGKIHAWDVVNEAIKENGKLRKSEWVKILGDDFIEQAFRIAAEELPKDVDLIYNDFGMTNMKKVEAVATMVGSLKKKGIRIDGVGIQGHWSLQNPRIKEIEASLKRLAETGVKIHITELDIDVLPRHPKMYTGNANVKLELENDPKFNPYKDGLPEDIQQKLANRYASLFKLFVEHSDSIKRVTFWGPSDGHTWLKNWPIKGRTNYPLLFDREAKPKPAFHAVIKVTRQASAMQQK